MVADLSWISFDAGLHTSVSNQPLVYFGALAEIRVNGRWGQVSCKAS